jgi:hypothetical protein
MPTVPADARIAAASAAPRIAPRPAPRRGLEATTGWVAGAGVSNQRSGVRSGWLQRPPAQSVRGSGAGENDAGCDGALGCDGVDGDGALGDGALGVAARYALTSWGCVSSRGSKGWSVIVRGVPCGVRADGPSTGGRGVREPP